MKNIIKLFGIIAMLVWFVPAFLACDEPNGNDNGEIQIYPHGLAYATPAKSQEGLGICWLFASNAVLETYIKKNTSVEVNLSENHARQAIHANSLGITGDTIGGNATMMMMYWTRGEYGGPVLTQNDFPYNGDINFTNWNQNAPRYGRVTNYQAIPNSTLPKFQDNPGYDIEYRNKIKAAITNHGSVFTALYSAASQMHNSPDGVTYYYNHPNEANLSGTNRMNHYVQILGWNDNFSANNFKNPPPGNGAWYVKNSTTYGSERFHWVSYYQFLISSSFIAGYDPSPVGNVYDYTPITILTQDWTDNNASPRWWANIFDCEDEDADLAEIIIRVHGNSTYNIYIATGEFTQNAEEDRVLLNSAFSNKVAELRIAENEPVNKYSGFYTLKLDTPIAVGQKSFAIVVEGQTLDPSGVTRWYYVRTQDNPNFVSNPRESYKTHISGTNKTWTDWHLLENGNHGNFYIYGVVTGSRGQTERGRVR